MSEPLPRIPMLDLAPEIDMLWDDLMDAAQRVLRSGRFILGPEVAAFESEVAAYLGVTHAVGVNSGTDALVISLRALGIGPGDEVITTPFTFFATPESISNVGATPVFVDIDERTFNLDPSLIEPAITERTKAIVPVHLFGQSCDMDPIMSIARRHGLTVIEDVAQAMGGSYKGRKLGTIGHAAALSFFPSKNLGGFGDGGMVVTDDERVAEMARMLRAHGSKQKYVNEMLGYNSRLDELQAALLRVRLGSLDAMNSRRRMVAGRYDRALAPVVALRTPLVHRDVHHVYHQYTISLMGPTRDRLKDTLARDGIRTMAYYSDPCHLTPVFSDTRPDCPVTERVAKRVLSLPCGPFMTEEEIEHTLCSVAGAS